MRITIIGGGNIGTQFAVHCSEKNHEVVIFTSTPEVFNNHLEIVDETGVVTHEGDICLATSDPALAFSNADLIIITFPPMLMNDVAELINKYSDKESIIGVVPGSGGCECAFSKCIKRGNIFFGIERVPAVARLIKKGRTVKSTGYRDLLKVAAIPQNAAKECAEIVSSIFDIPTLVVPNYLNLTLTPSNPILHTTRLKTIFKDWNKDVVYDKLPLFYEEWDDDSSELLIKCDEEVQAICKSLKEFELDYVVSLKKHYESYSVEEMTQKISSIKAFKGLETPSIKVEGGYVPNLNSRYFVADFSYGLIIIKQIGMFANVNTPNIDSTLEWYDRIKVNQDSFSYSDYDINNISDFSDYYLR